ncbi:hypothetical protein FRB96_006349 [Tulasnella sp. 330]|nr:hypothetical protein FRB96_006349 [Tulasnella sp. 330]KAG8884256.1 hypothetical protein FRB97_004761 [Tulasnella sp. 331]
MTCQYLAGRWVMLAPRSSDASDGRQLDEGVLPVRSEADEPVQSEPGPQAMSEKDASRDRILKEILTLGNPAEKFKGMALEETRPSELTAIKSQPTRLLRDLSSLTVA